MARRRVLIVLLPPPELSARVQALRAVLGDPRIQVLAPHVTLVPPLNLGDDALLELRRLLRAVATRTDEFRVEVGPTATFAPVTPTLHLRIDGDDDALPALRDRLHEPPVDRNETRPFSPHMTLRNSMPSELLPGALAALVAPLDTWSVDRLHLLEQFRTDAGLRWRTIVEEPFGGPDVVGRGGIELVLRTVTIVEPEVRRLLAAVAVTDGQRLDEIADADRVDADPNETDPNETDPGAAPTGLVVAAELPDSPGRPVAAAIGSVEADVAMLRHLVVTPEHRRMGIGRHVVAQWCTAAARRGAGVVIAPTALGGGVLASWGFVAAGETAVRRLGHSRRRVVSTHMSEPTSTTPSNRREDDAVSNGPRWATALVTGASSGIGDAFARRLAAEGTDLVVVARDIDRLEALAGELRTAHGILVEVIGADLTAPVARAAIEKRLTEEARPLDLLVNNAGFGTSGDFADLPIGREEQEVQVNVLAVLRLTSAALGPMVARGSGTVLNVGSIAGLYPGPGSATYCATKAFVNTFGDAVYEELRGTGVSITTSLPGFTRTEFQARSRWDDQSNVPRMAWLSADKVAVQSLDAAAAGKARVVPSLGYKVLVGSTTPLPASSRRWLLGRRRRAAR